MNEASHQDDLGLRLPLTGVQWIEASAGTGKTFTLATLYARLVIEAGYPISSLLAVTFTEAATQELRTRLRQRLALAHELAAGNGGNDGDDSDARRITAPLVAAASAREGAQALRLRLQQAVQAMDLAPIFTIHGFCHRALADHALAAGQPLQARCIVENEQALREEVATEFWRRCAQDMRQSATLQSLWESPAKLAQDLRELLALDDLSPSPQADIGDDAETSALARAGIALAQAFVEHGEHAHELLQKARAQGQVHRAHVSEANVDAVWQALAEWQPLAASEEPRIAKLEYFASSRLKDRTNKQQTTPASPLFDAIDTWLQAKSQVEARAQQERIRLVHAARDYARQRLDAHKRERGLIGYDDMLRGVDEALHGGNGATFAQCLRQQYRVALVDEFQDTDPRQWRIFARLFLADGGADEARALFLIGDPKQAIYRFRGGDVHAYLAARERADARHALARNFRSRPALLAAVTALFARSGEHAFAQAGIDFLPIAAAGRVQDADLRIGDAVAPALSIDRLPDLADASIDAARAAATTACVARIHETLAQGQRGEAMRRGKDGWRGIAPGDIAVLVERNEDAEVMRDALTLAGIPCVSAGRRSLYDSDEAQEWLCILHALAAPADEPRLRAALATVLLGFDAAALVALEEDENAHRHWQDRAQDWHRHLEQYGLLALANLLCAENAPRLLRLADGQRRLSNHLQLAEELQSTPAAALGAVALLDELEKRIAAADARNDAEQLRLESDAACVKILTLHKSKGLEFDLVFLPYAGIRASDGTHSGTLGLARYHEGERRVAMLFADKATKTREQGEQFAEKLRLFYVGVTRARLAVWLAWGAAKEVARTPLAWLLHRGPEGEPVRPLGADAIEDGLRRLQAWAREEGGEHAIEIRSAPIRVPTQPLVFAPTDAAPPAAIAHRRFSRDWWVYSFSQLTREQDGDAARGARDEAEPSPVVANRFAGARFGNALHAALERCDFAAWRDWSGDLPPPGEFATLQRALRSEGYGGDNDLRDGLPLLSGLVANTLNARLPEGTRLCDVPAAARCAEMEFHLGFAAVAMPELLALLHAHGVVGERRAFGLRQRIEGLLTGYMDLVYECAGRYYVLDYKSNQLPDYAPATLARSVREHEYDLQYTLYTLALHRWLRFRLGAAYDYDRHIGGVRYLYCRGLDGASDHTGIHHLKLPRALIESLDALFAQPAPAAGAALAAIGPLEEDAIAARAAPAAGRDGS
jgi:exodeoxyribonuclease V beta subunit